MNWRLIKTHLSPNRSSETEEQIFLEEQLATLEEAAGAWSDESHPDMLAGQDIDNGLANLRQSWVRPVNLQNGATTI